MIDKLEARARSMFAGFRPKPQEVRDYVTESTSRQGEVKAIQRYARAAVDITRMRDKSLPVLPHQETALAQAGGSLDRTRYHGSSDLASTFRNPQLARDVGRRHAGRIMGPG